MLSASHGANSSLSSLLGPLGSVIKDSLRAGLKWTTVFMKCSYWAGIVMSCVQISSRGTGSHSEFEACLQNKIIKAEPFPGNICWNLF